MRSTAYRWPSASAPWKERAARSAGCWEGYSGPLEAPLRRLQRCPHLRNELHEAGQESGLARLLGSGAALRRDGVRPGLGDDFECPAGYPHGVDQFYLGYPGATVGATVIRQRQGPKELVPRPRVLRHVVVEDSMHRAVEPLRPPVRLRV